MNNDISNYLNSTKNASICISISIVIIIIFFLTPLSKFLLVSTVGKIVAILILSYAFIINAMNDILRNLKKYFQFKNINIVIIFLYILIK